MATSRNIMAFGILLLATSAYAGEFSEHSSSVGRSGASSSTHGSDGRRSVNTSPISADNGMTDADYERNQSMIDNDEIDESVDSTEGVDTFTPDDVPDQE